MQLEDRYGYGTLVTISSSNAKNSTLANPDDPLTLTQATQSKTTNGNTVQTENERVAPSGQSPAPNMPFARVSAASTGAL